MAVVREGWDGTVVRQGDGHVLLGVRAGSQHHGRSLRGEEAEGHVCAGHPVLIAGVGGQAAVIAQEGDRLPEGVRDGGTPVERRRDLCSRTQARM